ncbi:MAG: hypothetical protein MUC35_04400 [Candidatus Margulisbacteria bacterium]|jgi:hypothetical protein|nr:hypothetical protein [Candidatus Margulisiibacteriota bacterium]
MELMIQKTAGNRRADLGLVRANVDYVRSALPQRAGELFRLFKWRNGRLTDRNYKEAVKVNPDLNYTFPGQIIPPLVLALPHQLDQLLKFYTLEVRAITSERWVGSDEGRRYDPQTILSLSLKLNFLQNYLLVLKPGGKMLFVSDDHSHLPYALSLATSLGQCGPEARLFHVDEHYDAVESRVELETGPGPLSPDRVAHFCRTRVQINDHLSFASRAHLIARRNIINTVSAGLLSDDALRCLPDTWDKLRKDPDRLALGELAAEIRRTKAAGQPTILDLDLDYLAFKYDRLFPSAIRRLFDGLDFSLVLGELLAAAQEADFIFIATSPDYLQAPAGQVIDLIKQIVRAA